MRVSATVQEILLVGGVLQSLDDRIDPEHLLTVSSISPTCEKGNFSRLKRIVICLFWRKLRKPRHLAVFLRPDHPKVSLLTLQGVKFRLRSRYFIT